MVGRRGEIFEVEKTWKKNIYAGREDGIFVHPENGLNKIYMPVGRMGFLFIRKMASTGSSATGALVVAGSLQPCR